MKLLDPFQIHILPEMYQIHFHTGCDDERVLWLCAGLITIRSVHIKIQYPDVYFKLKPLKSHSWWFPHLFLLILALQKAKAKGGVFLSPPVLGMESLIMAFHQSVLTYSAKFPWQTTCISPSLEDFWLCYVKHCIHYEPLCLVSTCPCRTVSIWIKCSWVE